MHGQGQGPWSQKALTFKVGGTQWIEWKRLLSETPHPATSKKQEHKAVGLRAGGAGGPKVKASEVEVADETERVPQAWHLEAAQ